MGSFEKKISETFLNYAKNKTYSKFISHELKINHRVKSKKLLNSFKLAREIYTQNISAKYKNKKLIDHLKNVYKTSKEDQININNNLRTCNDCHNFMKLVSKIEDRKIILSDANRVHVFENGNCCCNDSY